MKDRYIKALNYVIACSNAKGASLTHEAYAWNKVAYFLTEAYRFVTLEQIDLAAIAINQAVLSTAQFGVTIRVEDYFFWIEPVVETPKPSVIKALMPNAYRGETNLCNPSGVTEFVEVCYFSDWVDESLTGIERDMENCEFVFNYCQNGKGNGYSNADRRSFSVGDIVSINDERFYQCEGVGWKQVNMRLEEGVYHLIRLADFGGRTMFQED